MTKRTVHCVKLGTEAEGLARPPVPGELGRRIWESVSQEAWSGWLGHQTMLINEYRLTPFDPETREFLMKELEKYFFGEGSARPEGYVASEGQGADSPAPASEGADPAGGSSPGSAEEADT